MREQANLAISMADVIIFLTDIKQGVTAADQEIAIMLKKSKKPVVLVCNKADNMSRDRNEIYEFYNLGMGEPYPVSAANALGIGDVLDALYENFPEKSYGSIVLPQGKYEAFRIIIGNGKGHNWWCVMFPPLCFTDVTKGQVEEEKSKEELDEVIEKEKKEILEEDSKRNNKKTNEEDSDNIKIKFKVVEIFKGIAKKK